MAFKHEMAAIQQVELEVLQIALVRMSARLREDGVMSAPYD